MNFKALKHTLYKIIFSLLAAFIGTIIFELVTYDETNATERIQQGISDKVLRFHVIANSDSDYDQNLKLIVKDGIVSYMEQFLTDEMSLEDACDVVISHQDEILSIASDIIRQNGYSYDVSCEIENCYFPVKVYGDITLPDGIYRSFTIKIGNACGKNWWCILYPPLCFVDVSYGVVPDESKDTLRKILSTDEYRAVTTNEPVSFRFKYLTFLNNIL